MKLKRLKVTLWHRYILYYCIIFIIPFIILASFIFKLSLNNVEKQFESSIKNNLEQSMGLLSSYIEVLDNISMEISKDSYLTKNMIGHDYYSKIGNEIISRYISSQNFIDDIIIFYFGGNEKYYSSKGSYNDISILINDYYKDINISKLTLRHMFYLSTPQMISLPSNNKESVGKDISYIFPIFDTNGRQSGTITFLLNKERIKNILPKHNKNSKNEIYITNNNNSIILGNTVSIHEEFLDGRGKIKDELFKNSKYEINGKKYNIIKLNYDELGLNFVNIIDNKDLATSLLNTKLDIIKILILIFLVGLILILLISYFQYKPIRRINNVLSSKRESYDNKNRKNELENIEILVTSIIDQNKELIVKNEALYHIDKNQLLLELIEGMNQENEDKKLHPFISDLESKGNKYYIMLLKKTQISKESKLMIRKMFPIEEDGYMALTIQIPLQDKLGILVVHKNMNISMQESLNDIESKISVLGDDIYFYCGQIYDELSKINHSYIEAMIACNYIINDTKNKSIIYREVNYSSGHFLRYPSDSEEKLAHGLKQGTKEVVNDSLEQIFNFIYSNKYHTEEIKVYSFYLINFIVRNAAAIEFPHEEINIKELIEYRTLEDLEENLLQLVDKINEFIISKRSKVRDEFKEGIFKDILQNYTSHDLSLELLSQKYDYSVPYLSKMIKEETGMTFTKYIQELRLKYVKEKLIETDLSIKEIIFQAGYYDISNFSRKFKNITGVTPGQYREINKNNKTLEMI